MKIAVVGIGRVGSTVAYALTSHALCDELILVNRTFEVALGEVHDLQHAAAFSEKPMQIKAETAEAVTDCDIIILTASVHISNAKSRMEFGPANIDLYRGIMPSLIKNNPDAIYIVVANPVDVLTYFLISEYNLDWQKVIGTGTLIDSARYRLLLSQKYNIHAEDIRAYILGEHGETQFVVQSTAQAGGESIEPSADNQQLFEDSAESGMEVYRLKGHTNYGIASAVEMMVATMVNDQRHTMPVSLLLKDYAGVSDVCLSVPAVIGSTGVLRVMHPQFSDEEIALFQHSAQTVKAEIERALQGI